MIFLLRLFYLLIVLIGSTGPNTRKRQETIFVKLEKFNQKFLNFLNGFQ